ncbi:MAG: cytochrome C [Nitrospinae bacterium CG11_big_fil_rev_8_21_14_0_20_45_15]|nr:MAG: cytochrome C [Nitrospinae bacterium CG11_big_fil_rev_8_21_14_0_20_45_15]
MKQSHSGIRSILTATFLITLVTLGFSAPAFSQDCVQKRSTPKAPDSIAKLENPLQATPENTSAGQELFNHTAKPLACIQCHGINGNGHGMMARGMEPKPRDFTCSAMMSQIPDGQLFWIIKNGSQGTGMMAYKALEENQIWQLILHIRHLGK